jgi:hypothetical protein
MKLFEVKKDYKLFVDLDGVMADLDKHVKEVSGKTFDELRASGSGFTEFVAQEREQGFTVFDELDKMPDADQLWNYIVKYTPDILTATGSPVEKATAEKIRWVHDNLSGFDNILTTVSGAHKHKYAAPNHILIDDRDKAILPWREAGGIGILHTSASDTIAQLKQLGL